MSAAKLLDLSVGSTLGVPVRSDDRQAVHQGSDSESDVHLCNVLFVVQVSRIRDLSLEEFLSFGPQKEQGKVRLVC